MAGAEVSIAAELRITKQQRREIRRERSRGVASPSARLAVRGVRGALRRRAPGTRRARRGRGCGAGPQRRARERRERGSENSSADSWRKSRRTHSCVKYRSLHSSTRVTPRSSSRRPRRRAPRASYGQAAGRSQERDEETRARRLARPAKALTVECADRRFVWRLRGFSKMTFSLTTLTEVDSSSGRARIVRRRHRRSAHGL